MRRIGIGYGNVKYASVVGNNTVNTAIAGAGSTNVINTLAEGAIAIYGLKISTGLQELITTTIAGTPANFANYSEFIIFQGGKGTEELIEIGRFKPNELAGFRANAYIAPTKSVSYLGYDGSTGLLNLPTIVNGDSAAVEVKTRMGSVNPIFQDYFVADAGVLTSTATAYSILALLANQLNAEPTNVRHVKAEIVTNASGTAITAGTTGSSIVLDVASGTPTVTGSITNGSKTLTYALSASTFSATGQGVAAGQYISIAGILYKITAVDYTTSSAAFVITLDRAYEGTTLSAAAASNFVHYTTQPTTTNEFGLKITGYVAGHDIIVSRSGVLQYATLSTESTAVPIVKASYGMGTYSQVADMENQGFYWRGGSDTAELPNKSPLNKYAVSGKTYDIYSILVKTQYEAPFGFSNKTGNNISNISVAFETGYTSAGDNQTAFDDIVNALAGYYSVPIENGSLA